MSDGKVSQSVTGGESIRCPRCRSIDTTWTKLGGVLCGACGLKAESKHDSPASYEAELASYRGSTWDEYQSTERLERHLRAEDERLDDLVAARARPLEIEDVKSVFAWTGEAPRVHCKWGEAVQQEILGTIAMLLWGQKPKLGKTWYIRDPKRSAFATLGQVLRFHAGELGLSPVKMEIAETNDQRKTDLEIPEWLAKSIFADGLDPDDERLRLAKSIRRVGGMRSGHVHTKASANGCTGGAKNATAIELGAIVAKRIEASKVHPTDVALLIYMHRDGEAKPDRKGTVVRALLQEGILTPTARKHFGIWEPIEPKPAIDAAVSEHGKRIAKRLQNAAEALEDALRLDGRERIDKQTGRPCGYALVAQPDGTLLLEPREASDVTLLAPAREDDRAAKVARLPATTTVRRSVWDAA